LQGGFDVLQQALGSSFSAHKHIKIGRHCLLGHYLTLLDNEHGVEQRDVPTPSAPITIGDHVWIGSCVKAWSPKASLQIVWPLEIQLA
jgi:hypothetical protein